MKITIIPDYKRRHLYIVSANQVSPIEIEKTREALERMIKAIGGTYIVSNFEEVNVITNWFLGMWWKFKAWRFRKRIAEMGFKNAKWEPFRQRDDM